jgi:hypothetical protein
MDRRHCNGEAVLLSGQSPDRRGRDLRSRDEEHLRSQRLELSPGSFVSQRHDPPKFTI